MTAGALDRRTLLGRFGAPAAVLVLSSASPSVAATSGDAVYVEQASDTKIWVWTRTAGRRWIRYELRRFTNQAIRQDAWRIQAITAVQLPGDAPAPGDGQVRGADLTTAGNYEYAIKLAGGSDHFGGLHGDELLTSFLLLTDGRRAPAVAPGTVTSLTSFELAQDTQVLDPDVAGAVIGDMHVRHLFTAGGLRLRWVLNWRASRVVEYAYGAMLPAVRGVTTRFRYLDRAVEHDISVAGHGAPPADSYGLQMYNHVDGASLSVEVGPEFFGGYTRSAGRGLWVYDGADYNKVYPTRVSRPEREQVTPTTTWNLDATYTFHYPI